MKTSLDVNGCWPNRQQRLMLQAALFRGDKALDAWQKWLSLLPSQDVEDLENLDTGTRRLFPLLHDNLKSHGASHPYMDAFKVSKRRTWCQNTVLLEQMEEVLHVLGEANIETMLLKGAALLQHGYANPGLRPMADFDILVPTSQIQRAFDILLKRGCISLDHPGESMRRLLASKIYKATFHSAHLLAPQEGREFDLHWHVLSHCLQQNADDDFWESSVPIEMNGFRTRTLCAADHLLHICFHGVQWNAMSPIRWVADAMIILSTSPHLNWDRLLEQTQKRGIVLEIFAALRYLYEYLEAPIPKTVFDGLRESPVAWGTRLDYALRTRPPCALALPWLHYRRYLRCLSSPDVCSPLLYNPVTGFPLFLQYLWRLERPSQLPLHIGRGFASKIKKDYWR